MHLDFAEEASRNKYLKEPTVDEKSSFKKIKKAELLKNVYDPENWNSLFLNPNTVLAKMSEKFNLEKKDILGKEIEDGAVRLALCETEILQETKNWLQGQNINIEAFDQPKKTCPRSSKVVIVKNIPNQITK